MDKRLICGVVFNVFVAVISVFLPTSALAQSPTLVNFIGSNEGFSESSVYSILCDKKGFMWYGTADGLWQYDGYKHTVYRHNREDSTTLSNNFVRRIFEDSNGNIWACTLGGGINLLNPATGKFTRAIQTAKGLKKFEGKENSGITQGPDGSMWIGSTKGLEKLNIKTGESRIFPYAGHGPNALSGDVITTLFFCRNGKLFIGYSSDGFDILDPSSGAVKNYRNVHTDPVLNIRSNVIRAVTEDHAGNIWIGTYGGLLKFDVAREQITHFAHHENDPQSLVHNSIWSLAVSKDNKLWIASFGGGLGRLDLITETFENDDVQPDGVYGIESRELPEIYLDKVNVLWVGTNGAGIYKINRIPGLHVLKNVGDLSNRTIRKIQRSKHYVFFLTEAEGLYAYDPLKESMQVFREPLLTNGQVVSASEDRNGNIWIGTNNGLNFFDVRRQRMKSFLNDPDDNKSLGHNSILSTFVDSKGSVWIGHAFGLSKWDSISQNFQKIKLEGTDPIYRIAETNGGLWLGSTRHGLHFMNAAGEVTKTMSHSDENKNSISSNYVTTLFEDSRKVLWVGTNQGLNSYKPENDSFVRYTNLPEQRVGAISEDTDHNIIVQLEENFYEIAQADSLPGAARIKKVNNPLQTLSVRWDWLPGENSTYLLSGKNIASFRKDSIRPNSHVPPVVITQFRLYSNTKHKFPLSDTTFSSSYLERVSLPYSENVFSVEFAALDFLNPKTNQYAYKLEGFDDDWIYCGTRRFITYTNLDPGQYTLRVKGSNNDGVWNESGTALSLRIAPPFYRTWWAYMVYIFGFLGLWYWSWSAVVNRERLLAQVAIEKKENQALQELDTLKNKFFANITHEFRTPLTLIQGPTDRLLESAKDKESHQLLNLIKNNSARLLTLINQLLDFARFDAREMKVNMAPVKMTVFLRTVIGQFSSLASSKNIDLVTTLPENLPQLNTDQEKVETILTNLVSNALKFTPAGGRVTVIAQWLQGQLNIIVRDTGRGIPESKIKYIFDRFYQVEPADAGFTEGTGIGLALVKEYINLLGGAIHVTSEPGAGTTFEISIPAEVVPTASQEARGGSEHNIETAATEEMTPVASQPLILLVEDNEDLRFFIRNCLGTQYNYLEARNGKEGLSLARRDIPDIIVSDLMMPEMDGVELCLAIKKDKRTDHIPFVMLTAKAADESKIEGLRSGADDYLVKPFNKTELVLKIQNLILLREKLQVSIKNKLLVKADDVQVTSLEEQFIVKARTFVSENMSDESLSVEKLAAALDLSREQCYRKILAVSGLSPSALIRSLRLQRAGQLLASKWGHVSQVAYEVGFSNLSYFSKAFKEEFGVLPSEYEGPNKNIAFAPK